MHEVAKGFQHKINNPLEIIFLTLSSAKRAAAANPAILERIGIVDESACRIKQAVIDISGAQRYEVEHVGHVVGSMASPASLRIHRLSCWFSFAMVISGSFHPE